MSRIDSIRAQLLAEQAELESELARISNALAAIGGETTTEKKGKTQTAAKGKAKTTQKAKRKQSPPSQDALAKTLAAIRELNHPVKNAEVAEKAGLSPSLTGKAANVLFAEGQIKLGGPREDGYAAQRGKVPMWVPADYQAPTNGDQPTTEETQEQPQQEELPVA